jgi:hypothetical protein
MDAIIDNINDRFMDSINDNNNDDIIIYAETLGNSYSKKSPLPSIADFPCLADSPKLSSYQVLGQSRIQQSHITRYNHQRIEAQ